MSNNGKWRSIKYRNRNQLKKRWERAKVELMDSGRRPENADVLEHLLDKAGY